MSDILYSGVVLDENSRSQLVNRFLSIKPKNWKTYAHHMTHKFKAPITNQDDLGKTVTLKVTEIGFSDQAIAVKVEGYDSSNKIPHVTLFVNNISGKPMMSNDIKLWLPISEFTISGVIKNITSKTL